MTIFTVFCLLELCGLPVFAQQVDTAWVRRYNGPGNGDDQAAAIAVDDSGNVYVTGSSFDSATGYDFATIKYLPNGDTAWVRRYNGPDNKDDFASALVLDANSNVYVTGRSNGGFATIKYDSLGKVQWVRQKGGVIFIDNEGAYGMALDKTGNVYVTGAIFCGEVDCWGTVKYDSQGNELWFKYNSEGTRAVAITVDTGGNAFVTGDNEIVKYAAGGNLLWTQVFPVLARAIALDNAGNVYVTGRPPGPIFYNAYKTIKYNSNGNQLWLREYFPDLFVGAGPFALAVDKAGNVYVTGSSGYGEDDFWVTVKYDSAGTQLWDKGLFTGIVGRAIAVDTDCNCYVAGIGSSYTFSAVKYDHDGNQVWLKSYYLQPEAYPAEAVALTLDTKGNVYATGYSVNGITGGSNYTTIKYSPLPQLKGDLNADGILSAADVVLILNCVFLGIPPPNAPPAACDLNCDGLLTSADVVILLNMTFLQTPAPC